MLYVNINGYKSKMESVKQLLEELDIDIVMLAETKVYSAASIDIKGFQAFPVTRSRNKGGGLYVCIRHGFCQSVLIDEEDNAEFISVRLCSQPSSIRLMLSYGPQEKESENKRTDFYESLSIQIQRAQIEGDMVILVGDFNAKLGSDVKKGDIHSMSKNGQLLWDVIKTFNLEVINSADIFRGVFTRIKATKKKVEKSVLDYVIVSDQFKDQFLSCLIDEDKQLTPLRNLKKGSVYSDHNSLLFSFTCLPEKGQIKSSRSNVWNFNDTNGFEKFMNLTDSRNELYSAAANNEDIDKMYSCWNIKLNSILHKCFRKKRVGNQCHIYNSEIKQLIKSRKVLKKASAPKKKIEKLYKVINEKVADFNYRFIKSNSNKSGTIDKQSFWKVKRVLVPKSVSVPSLVTNKSGHIVSDPFHIKEEYRKNSPQYNSGFSTVREFWHFFLNFFKY